MGAGESLPCVTEGMSQLPHDCCFPLFSSRSSSKRFAEQTAAIVALLVLGVPLPLIRPS